MKFTALICIYNPDIDALNKTVKSIKDFDKTVEILIIDNCSDVYVPKIKGTKIFKLRKNVDYKKVKEMGVLLSRGDFIMNFEEGETVSEWNIEKKIEKHR